MDCMDGMVMVQNLDYPTPIQARHSSFIVVVVIIYLPLAKKKRTFCFFLFFFSGSDLHCGILSCLFVLWMDGWKVGLVGLVIVGGYRYD